MLCLNKNNINKFASNNPITVVITSHQIKTNVFVSCFLETETNEPCALTDEALSTAFITKAEAA